MPAVTKSKKRSVTAAAAGEPSYAPPIYDPAAGKKALEALAPELDRLAEAELITVRVDVEAATYAALGVVGFVSSPDVRARFARLPREEFDVTHVDELELACFAALHALAEARAAGALETEARLPVALVTEALEVETRMQALCEYQLADAAFRAGHWSPGNPATAYNACLSVTVLPVALAKLSGLPVLWVFKVLIQVVFAVVPVVVQRITLRFGTAAAATLAGVYFAIFPTFLGDMPWLGRQEVAFVFLALMLLAATEPLAGAWWRRGLVALMALGVVLSHYSTTYLLVIALVGGLVLLGFGRFLARRRGWTSEGEPLVLLDHASGSRRLIDTALERHGARCEVVQELGHPTTVFRMVEAGIGISVMPALAVTDSVKAVDARGSVTATLDRSTLQVVQYPRGFTAEALSRLLAGRASDDCDELGEALRTGTPITIVDGDADAFAVELPRDTAFIEAIIACRQSDPRPTDR